VVTQNPPPEFGQHGFIFLSFKALMNRKISNSLIAESMQRRKKNKVALARA
jgi:hypothetical protein